MRGGERVLESLCALFPSADLFTLRYDPERVSPAISRHRVTTSFIDRLAHAPFARGRFRGLLPLFPLAAESFRLDDYDLVISSSHCVAAGVLAPPAALHVAYLHSPMRYAWEGEATYSGSVRGGALGRWAFRAATHYLRLWDAAASARPDLLIANSAYTRQRIRRYYRREAEVIEPPIDVRRFGSAAVTEDVGGGALGDGNRHNSPGGRRGEAGRDAPFLVVSALVPYKRVELAVQAMMGRKERLVVVGEGSERPRLEALAGPNVTFLGWVSDEELVRLFSECRALIHPAVDDFGMVMVEALAAGRPVIASREGGAADIVGPDETGILFDAPTVGALRGALDRLGAMNEGFDPRYLRQMAKRFDRINFERRFLHAVEKAELDRRRQPTRGAGSPVRARQLGMGRA